MGQHRIGIELQEIRSAESPVDTPAEFKQRLGTPPTEERAAIHTTNLGARAIWSDVYAPNGVSEDDFVAGSSAAAVMRMKKTAGGLSSRRWHA